MAISITGFAVTMAIPLLIVGFWKKRPVIAFVIAALLLIIFAIAPGIIKTFQAMMIYGTGDPQLMAGGISEAIVRAVLFLIAGIPVVAVFQWFMRRNYKKPMTKTETENTFS